MEEHNQQNKKKRNRLFDIALVAIGVIIVTVLAMAPAETTKRVPTDDTHAEFHEIFKKEGKKAAEKNCESCHKEGGVPFPPNHPPKYRCLFCHKMQ